jgi:putative acetyltransferase
MPPTIRPYRQEDAAATAILFHETVRDAAGVGYDEAQRAAWAPRIPEAVRWHTRLSEAMTLVAEDATGIVGFMSLRNDGYLDLAFVRGDRIGTGIAKALYDVLLQDAVMSGLNKLTTDASIKARRFFERQGWRLVREQHPVRRGIALTNYRMTLDLNYTRRSPLPGHDDDDHHERRKD